MWSSTVFHHALVMLLSQRCSPLVCTVLYSSSHYIYLLECSVDGRLHVSALHRFDKLLQILQQLWISLKVMIVKLNPVSQHIQHSTQSEKKKHAIPRAYKSGEEGMHHTYTAKFKNGAINSSFLISVTVCMRPVYRIVTLFLLYIYLAHSLNLAYPVFSPEKIEG